MIDRLRVWAGETFTLDATEASMRLASIARGHAERAFACEGAALRTIHETFDEARAWESTCAARHALAHDADAIATATSLAEALGFDRATLALDRPRLRVITPKGHENRAAMRAFYMHRDTWYGSPKGQVNVWVPLFDVGERDSFAIYPSAFGVRVDNDSASFDYDAFVRHGGFQSADQIAAAYPRALGDVLGPQRVCASAGQVFVFSPAHLHATTPNTTAFTRFSVDVRFVDMRDVEAKRGASDVDNDSRGSALVDYLRSSA